MKSVRGKLWLVASASILFVVGCSKSADTQVADSGSAGGGGVSPASISKPTGLGGGGAPASVPSAASSESATASSESPQPSSPSSPPPGSSSPQGSPSPYGGGFPQSGGGPPTSGGNPYAGTNFPQSGPGGPPTGGPSGYPGASGGSSSGYPGVSSGGRPGLAGGGGGGSSEPSITALAPAGAAGSNVYETKIKPILESNCYQCHRGSQAKAKLQLDSPAGIRQGGEHGPILIAGDPDKSPVVSMIKYESDRPMPPKNRLSEADVNTIVSWIRDGAVMPEESSPSTPTILELGFQERATRSFQHGHEEDAVKLAQAYILSTDLPGELYLEQMRWSPIRKRPVFASRIAVGVDLEAPSDLNDYRPIGSKQEITGGGTGFLDTAGPSLVAPNRGVTPTEPTNQLIITGVKTLQSTTGEMGRYLINRGAEIFDSGHLGTAFITLEDLVVEGNPETGGAATGTMGGPPGSGYPGGGPGFGGGPPPGSSSSSPFSFEDAGASAGGGGSVPSRTPPPPSNKPAVRTNHNRLTRGFTFLGTATTQELLRKAEKEGYDALVVFTVKVTHNKKSQLISNTCRAKVYLLGTTGNNKAIASSKELNNLEVQKKQIGPEVDKAMSAMMTSLQEAVALKDIPESITPEMIKTKRLATITSDKSLPILDALVEIKYWRYRGMIDNDEMEAAFGALISAGDASKLVSGPESDRIVVMKKYVR